MLQAIAGLLIVIGMIVLGAFLLNRIRSKGGFATFLPSTKNRLRISESLALDSSRQLILVERDGTIGHLLLLGAESEMILETNIVIQPSIIKDTIESPSCQNHPEFTIKHGPQPQFHDLKSTETLHD